MFRKTVAVLLAVCLLGGLCACGNSVETNKKIAIITAPKDEYPEDYLAARALAQKYPETVVLRECGDSRILQKDDPQIVTLAQELAADPDVGAIIFARAARFTSTALIRAKSVNPGLVTAAIEPEDEIKSVAGSADFVLAFDRERAANEIVAKAKEAGAEHFVFFSYPRLNQSQLTADEQNAFKSECENAGINFIADSGNDPASYDATGSVKANDVIKERLAYLTNNGRIQGENTALFSADSTVQQTLAELADENGYIYICPEFPCVFSGTGSAFNIALPENAKGIKGYVKALKSAVKGSGTPARLYYYDFELMTVFINASFKTAAGILQNGTEGALADALKNNLQKCAGSKDFTVSVSDYPNVVFGYCQGIKKFR